MFDSGMGTDAFLKSIQAETDVAPDIADQTWTDWLNELEQTLYSEIIREMAMFEKTGSAEGTTDFSDARTVDGADRPRYEDVYTVFADKTQLLRVSPHTGVILPDVYWKTPEGMAWRVDGTPKTMRVFYYVRPALKTPGSAAHVAMPPEWMNLVRAKLRGEAYKLVNEDAVAAKWMNDYNYLLEGFKQWVAARHPETGE